MSEESGRLWKCFEGKHLVCGCSWRSIAALQSFELRMIILQSSLLVFTSFLHMHLGYFSLKLLNISHDLFYFLTQMTVAQSHSICICFVFSAITGYQFLVIYSIFLCRIVAGGFGWPCTNQRLFSFLSPFISFLLKQSLRRSISQILK